MLNRLVSGSGDLKITKDGNVLLHEMQIQHPTASLIARASTTQDDMIGDGTTSIVLLIGELLKQAETYVAEGVHPRILTEGFELARKKCLEVLDKIKIPVDSWKNNGEILHDIARTSLSTKIHPKTAEVLTGVCVSALQAISRDGMVPDLHMVEVMEMQHKTEVETTLVKGLVLDHGGRHPDMPKRLENAYILTCNVSMEYEKSEVNSGFFYKTSEERERFLEAERDFIKQRVQKVIDLKRQVCTETNKKTFVVINQKGIDPLSLDMLAREGILALRRAKRRNMERLALACGGTAVNSVEELSPDVLGYAGLIYEYILGENKFTFVEECNDPKSVTILVKAPTKFSLAQLKDAIRDGLRAILNTIDDKCLVPGAGAFEIYAYQVSYSY